MFRVRLPLNQCETLDVKNCEFTQSAPGMVRCSNCGREVKTESPPDMVYASCGPKRKRPPVEPGVPSPVFAVLQPEDLPCHYRGGEIEVGSCDMCGSRGQPFKVYECGVFKKCSVQKKHSQITACVGCPKRSENAPTIGVIIPAFNCAKYLPDCVDSIRKQTLPPTRVIVVDDGSTDNTAEVLRGLNVDVITHPTNRGANAARQTGLDALQTETEWVVLADADAYYQPDFLESLHGATTPETDLVYCSWRRENTETGKWEILHAKPWNVRELWSRNYISMCSLIRREKLPALTSESPIDDWEIWMKIAEAGGRGTPVEKILFTAYERPEGKTAFLRHNPEAARRERQDLQKRYRQFGGPPRVLFLLADLSQGGIGTYHLNLFKALGPEVEVSALVFHYVTPHTDWALVRELRRYTRVVCTSTTATPEDKRKHPEIEWETNPAVYDRLIDQCDVVTTAVNDPHVMRRTDWRGKPLIVQLHSTCEVTGMIARTLAPYATKYVVTSEESRRVATGRFGVPPEQIEVVELAVDFNRVACWRRRETIRRELAPGREMSRWVLFFGRYSPEKRVERVAQTVAILNRETPGKWLGVFAGSGWKETDLRPRIAAAIPSDHLFIPWGPIGEILRASNVFVCASEYEGGPTSSLEALVAGVPICSTDVGILNTIAPRPYASIGRDPSPEDIAAVLSGMDFSPRTDLAREYAGRFSIGRKAAEWEKIITSVR